MIIKTLHLQIVKRLKSKSNRLQAEKDKEYHKKGYKSYGLRIPEVKAVSRYFEKVIKELPLEDKFRLAELLYKSGYAEHGRVGNRALALSVSEIGPKDFSRLDRLLNDFNNWDEVDDFSINVTQPLLINYTKEVLDLLWKWNKSANAWKRRASMVAFVRKIGESGKFTKEVLALSESLVNDKEGLVLKAVGWALKDSMRGDKENVLNYVKSLRRKGVPSIVILYAVRDLEEVERQMILDIKSKE